MTRKYGTGSLHQRSSDGRWIGRLPDGRGGYRYVTGTDEDTVRRRLEEMRRERDRTTLSTLDTTVSVYGADADAARKRAADAMDAAMDAALRREAK